MIDVLNPGRVWEHNDFKSKNEKSKNELSRAGNRTPAAAVKTPNPSH